MNPRRPTPSGPKYRLNSISNPDPTNPTEEDLAGFFRWCLQTGTSERTCIQYRKYLEKPMDRDNKWSLLAWKKYYKYIGRDDIWKSIRLKKSSIDLYIPGDSDVLESVEAACGRSPGACWTYRLLVYSGMRLVEVTRVLSENNERWIRADGFWKYPLSWTRGPKQAYYMYTPVKPPRILVRDRKISELARKMRLTPPKYIRKWVATKMISLGIPEEVVNFIQGRIPQSILARHYLNLTILADKYYPRYVEYLGKLGIPVKTVEPVPVTA